MEAAIELRHLLHSHPELSNEEVWTKKTVMEFVRTHTTNLKVVDRGTWFYAVYSATHARQPENLAFRADLDALPMDEYIKVPWASRIANKSHKCGHDGHSATLAAFALEVDQKGAENNIFFMWQPAEETGEGAQQCVPMLTEEKIDRIYGYHNMPGFPNRAIVVRDEILQCASTGMIIKMRGTPAHASQPENGKNPSLSISRLVQAIPSLTAQSQNLLLCTVVQINVGNRQFGMSAYYGELLLTIRAQYDAELEQLRKRLEELSREEGRRETLTVEFEYSDSFPETRNHKSCVDHVRSVASRSRFLVHEMREPFRASEDFGHYTKVKPGCYFFIGSGEKHPPIHTKEYDFNDELIPVGVEMFKGLAGVRDALACL